MTTRGFTEDFYDRLGLQRDCTPAEIRRQYRLLARLYHPDVNPAEDAQARFLAFRRAYDVLSDERKRREFTRWLASQPRFEQPLVMQLTGYPATLGRSQGTQRVYLLVEIKGEASAAREAEGSPPLNVILVLDRSSSMRGRRLFHVKQAARQIIDNLSPADALGVISFNDRGSVVLPAGIGIDKGVARGAIDSITASGGTEIASGLRMGFKQAVQHHNGRHITRVILLTDGRTYGDEELAFELADLAASQMIGVTAMGLGTDWNDQFLDELAQRANGEAHYISDPSEAVAHFHEQLQRMQRTFGHGGTLDYQLAAGTRLLSAHEIAPGLRTLPVSDSSIVIGALPATPPLRLLLQAEVEIPNGDAALLGEVVLQATVTRTATRHQLRRLVIADVNGDERRDPPADNLYLAAQRVAILSMQERTWEAIDEGRLEDAEGALRHLADRFLDIGAEDLAEAAHREADEVRITGTLTENGRKSIKYGTRRLALPAPEAPLPAEMTP